MYLKINTNSKQEFYFSNNYPDFFFFLSPFEVIFFLLYFFYTSHSDSRLITSLRNKKYRGAIGLKYFILLLIKRKKWWRDLKRKRINKYVKKSSIFLPFFFFFFFFFPVLLEIPRGSFLHNRSLVIPNRGKYRDFFEISFFSVFLFFFFHTPRPRFKPYLRVWYYRGNIVCISLFFFLDA